jgi:hypothetical protein
MRHLRQHDSTCYVRAIASVTGIDPRQIKRRVMQISGDSDWWVLLMKPQSFYRAFNQYLSEIDYPELDTVYEEFDFSFATGTEKIIDRLKSSGKKGIILYHYTLSSGRVGGHAVAYEVRKDGTVWVSDSTEKRMMPYSEWVKLPDQRTMEIKAIKGTERER